MNAAWLKYFPKFIRDRLAGRHSLQAFLGNTSWLFADKVLRMGIGLVVGVWIARYLGPDQYGLWSYAIAFAGIFGAFAGLGLDSIVIRELVRNPDQEHILLGTAFCLKLAGAALALICALVAILQIRGGDNFTLWLVGLSAAGYIFQSANVVDCFFQAKVNAKYSVIPANCAFILIAIVKIVLLLIAAPLIAFAWVGLAEIALTSAFLLMMYQVKRQTLWKWRCSYLMARTLLSESWPLLLSGLAVMLYMRLDMVMLGSLSGEKEVGIYAAATRLSEVWYFLPTAIMASLTPSIINTRATNAELYISRFRKLYFLFAWWAIGIALPLTLTSNWIVYFLYGVEYGAAGRVLSIHLWAGIAVFLGVASNQYLIIEGLGKIALYRTLIGLVCNIGLNMALIPSLGAVGAAWATVVAYFIATFSMIFFKTTRQHAVYVLIAPFSRR